MSAPPMSPEVESRNAQAQQFMDAVSQNGGVPPDWNMIAQGLPDVQTSPSLQSGQSPGANQNPYQRNLESARSMIAGMTPYGVDPKTGQIDWSKFKRSPIQLAATFLQPFAGAVSAAE